MIRSNGAVKKGMKRYVARRSRVVLRNNIDSDSTMVKCEAYDQIIINAGASAAAFLQSGGTFVNIYTLLLSSTSFMDNIGHWGRYKIVGMNVRGSSGASIVTLVCSYNESCFLSSLN